MSHPTSTSVARAVLTFALMVGAVSSAQAQIEYLTQQREVSVAAHAMITTSTPVFSDYGYVSYYQYDDVGDSKRDTVRTSPEDFGVFDRTLTATASYQDIVVTSTATIHSELRPDEIRLDTSAQLLNENQHVTHGTYQDKAFSVVSLTIRLAADTDLVLEQSNQISIQEEADSLKPYPSGVGIRSLDGTRYNFNGSNQLSLAAGDYTVYLAGAEMNRNRGLGEGSVISSLVIRAVPEASTWAMMGLGLVGVALGARRRRPATPRVA